MDWGGRTPLTFCHTSVLDTVALAGLTDALGPHQNVVHLPAPSLDRRAPYRAAEWVAHHRALLAANEVGPPYFLAGYSFGGVVALELARALTEAGEPVAYLAMIDTMRPKLRRRARRYRHLVSLNVKRAVNRSRLPGRRGGRRMDPMGYAIFRSYLAYDPVPYAGPVVLVSTADSIQRAAGDPTLGWTPFLPAGCDVHVVSGNHRNLFDDGGAEAIAKVLRRTMEEAGWERPPAST